MYGEMDFMELIVDMLDLDLNEEAEYEPDEIITKFEEEFGLPFQECYALVLRLLDHTPMVQSPLTKQTYNAFVSKKMPVMLMKKEAEYKGGTDG